VTEAATATRAAGNKQRAQQVVVMTPTADSGSNSRQLTASIMARGSDGFGVEGQRQLAAFC
jgi:hypothetical protein